MLSTISNPRQDHLSNSERLHIESNPTACVFAVTLRDPFGCEELIRVIAKDESFFAVYQAVNAARAELGLKGFEIFETIPVKNQF